MSEFSISISAVVNASSYEEAYEIEKSLKEFITGHDEVLDIYSIDVEQISDEGDDNV